MFDYAFIVHARYVDDLSRKYPLLKFVPKNILHWISLRYPPFLVSEISGLKDINSRQDIRGCIIGVPMTALQLIENRKLALKRIIQAVELAKKRGAKYVGLGAMTASLSRGGKDIIDNVEGVNITTGRTYTVINIVNYIEMIVSELGLDKDKICIGIMGAAGGIGSGVSILLANIGYRNFILIDLERKIEIVELKMRQIKSKHGDKINIELNHQISLLSKCKIIVTATSSPEVVLKSGDVSPGTIIINDAQPSDISPDLIFNRSDVLVIEGGVLHTENINCHINLGMHHKNDIFSCLAETLILSSFDLKDNYSIEGFDLESYKSFEDYGKKLLFSLCPQNIKEIIDRKRIKDFINL